MKEIPVSELPGYSGPEGTRIRRQFLYLERQKEFDTKASGPGEAFDQQYEETGKFLDKELARNPRPRNWNPGGDMNEERILGLPSGEQLHCISIHGIFEFWTNLFSEYANEHNLILAEIGDGLVRILVGRTAGETLELAKCRAYSTDGWRDGE